MIEVKNVSKKYRKVKALDDISFNIEEGKITCILGINGVGKSTILKSIAGLIKPDKGEILIDNEKLTYKTYDRYRPPLCRQSPSMHFSYKPHNFPSANNLPSGLTGQ